ncbi:hypothetical protein FTUN_4561 [Frigoriglobus tundricola]|uniref:Uncharacterized protein n=1 Tax=Frigoriglobus tundricola TaxID=2774151 RepID=A0A6M5YUR4_9BACT|nr:hypothetical protein FTUN_4561 [Frigoriglobus tundricola]
MFALREKRTTQQLLDWPPDRSRWDRVRDHTTPDRTAG